MEIESIFFCNNWIECNINKIESDIKIIENNNEKKKNVQEGKKKNRVINNELLKIIDFLIN